MNEGMIKPDKPWSKPEVYEQVTEETAWRILEVSFKGLYVFHKDDYRKAIQRLKDNNLIKESAFEKSLNDARIHFSCVMDYCKKQLRTYTEFEHMCQVQLKYEEAISELKNIIDKK